MNATCLAMLLLCGILGPGVSRSADPGASRGSDRLSEVFLFIFGFREARVEAVLIDREGRRQGWSLESVHREIPGCYHSAGSDEGIPDLSSEVDSAETAPGDTLAGGLEALPMYYEFRIPGASLHSLNDPAAPPKLLDEGGCVLRLDPLVAGRVTLSITGSGTAESGIGYAACKDTTSILVEPGVPSFWWLDWTTIGDRCIVGISRMSGEPERSGSAGH